ncbi:hypothetical protein VNO78_25006 [Psophocarpus tetragonolobus]|uniref:Uncharacterized protein n=1 Tax=Psophocarpus tetragonolobus TaxID=3891 RepID=A0AAN9S6W4_PSOTE
MDMEGQEGEEEPRPNVVTWHNVQSMVCVISYLFWRISDNWEWAGGYGPKFGLVAIVNTDKITHEDRERAWDELQRAAKEKKTRLFIGLWINTI